MSVKATKRRFDALKTEKNYSRSWTPKSMHFANKGGYAIKFCESKLGTSESPDKCIVAEKSQQSLNSVGLPSKHVETSQATAETLVSGSSCDIELGSRDASHTTPDDTDLKNAEEGHGNSGSATKSLSWDTERRNWFSKHLFPTISPQELAERAQQKSHVIGPINWKLSPVNEPNVETARLTVSKKSFPNEWEKERYRTFPRQLARNLAPLAGDLWVLDANQLLYAWEAGIISELPDYDDDDLDDRNKGDVVVKVLAIVQILWFVVQVIFRLADKLPTTQLEILTFSYAVCTVAAYFLLMGQTKDTQYSVTLYAARYAMPHELLRLAVMGPTDFGPTRKFVWIPNTAIHAAPDRKPFSTVRDLAGVSSVSLVVLGGLHCLAWKNEFPTKTEWIYWNVASVLTGAVFPIIFLVSWLGSAIAQDKTFMNTYSPQVVVDWVRHVKAKPRIYGYIRILTMRNLGSSMLLLGSYFVIVRLYVIFEVLRTLGTQPPEAFASTVWWANVPHFG
ncbi:hypothetical protein VFPPC_07494 [Pochonia chlamydosporia 170]|uniref:Uncharacterized protein n=1 Tax=Pochonia chlamydosporia 170 TaxID=1380566 RepID=A0A179FKN1_METCM|nr:hypothetical protein VFPPC_07494 [Pochonia chlamydosporia 170]OAQ65857.1 hypothetical protein VFPPC_07494 [Pochonia chlamydosporia 170]